MKTIKRFRTSNIWNIGEQESYFSDMAEKGYHLNNVGRFFYTFQKGEPQEVEYRIELTAKKQISEDHRAMYEEFGWEHASSLEQMHVFRSPKNAGATEIHTDPAEQSFMIQEFNKKLRSSLFTVVALTLIYLIGILYLLFMNRTPILNIVEGGIETNLFISVIYIYTIYLMGSGYSAMKNLRNQLLEGKPINHRAPYKKLFLRNNIIVCTALIFLIFTIINSGIHITKYKYDELLTDDAKIPVVRLAELETKYPYEVVELGFNSKDGKNIYTKDWSLFAPFQYEVVENFEIPIGEIPHLGGIYSPFISSNTYLLRSDLLSKPLAKDLVKRVGFTNEPFVKLDHPSFDALYISNENRVKYIVAAKGKVVTLLFVDTNSGEEELLEKIADAMTRK